MSCSQQGFKVGPWRGSLGSVIGVALGTKPLSKNEIIMCGDNVEKLFCEKSYCLWSKDYQHMHQL